MDLELTSKAIRFLTNAEAAKVLRRPLTRVQMCEWETVDFTFTCSPDDLAIVRSGSRGGSVVDVHGGWKYLTPLHMASEWAEIQQVAPAYKIRSQGRQ